MIRALLATLAFAALALPALAQDPEGGFKMDPEVGKQPAWTLGSGRTLWLFPAGHVYPLYIADPHRPMGAALAHLYTRTGIDDSTDARVGLAVGGRFGMLRLEPAHRGGRS